MSNNLGNKQIMASNIRRYLAIKGMTIKELAEELGISTSTVGDWCRAVAYPRIDKIEMMANLFGVTKADLVEDPADVRADILDRAFAGRPEMRTLFEAADKASKKDIKRVIKILNAFTEDY